MDFSEMMQGIRDTLANAWDRGSFILKKYWLPSLLLFVILGGGLIYWAGTGFSLQLGRSSAAGACTAAPNNGSCVATGGCTGTVVSDTTGCSGVTPVCCKLEKKTPWVYCDAATKACVQSPPNGNAVSSDYNAPDCSSAGGACAIGKCRKWEGDGTHLTDWKPLETPAGLPACEPLTETSETTFPGFSKPFYLEGLALPPGATKGFFTPTPEKPPAVDFPDCFYIQSYGGLPTELSGEAVPVFGATKKVTMSWFVVNNCPWEVHMVLLLDGGPKASFAAGVGQDPSRGGLEEGSRIISAENTADGRDFKSCWNNNFLQRPESCGKLISVEFDLNTYTCGSVGIQLDWWHRIHNNADSSVGQISDSYCDREGRCPDVEGGQPTGRGTGAILALNWGKDCTGLPGERPPGGKPITGVGTCPALPAQSAVKVAHPTAQCGTTQNVISWENPKTLNAAVNSVLRTEKKADGTSESKFIFGEGGCWNTFGINTFTDKDVKATSTYSYAIKTHPNVRSADVACKNGVPVTPPPSTAVSPSISPTTGVSPSTGPNTPVPSSCPGDADCDGIPDDVECPDKTNCPDTDDDGTPDYLDPDSDGDGIPDSVECPGGTSCPDTDGDGTPDYLDTDSDGDGIPDGTDCNRLVAGPCTAPVGQVQTGPGEATMLALIISALVSLLYVSYTHSSLGLRREAEDISRDQGPMDFRS